MPSIWHLCTSPLLSGFFLPLQVASFHSKLEYMYLYEKGLLTSTKCSVVLCYPSLGGLLTIASKLEKQMALSQVACVIDSFLQDVFNIPAGES